MGSSRLKTSKTRRAGAVGKILLGVALATAAPILQAAGQTILEAEDAVLVGVETTADAGASGGFRARRFDEVGDTLRFENVPPGVHLTIQFSLGRDNYRQCSLVLNGVDVRTLTFYPTGAWATYRPKRLYVETEGTLELRIDPDDFLANRQDTCAAIDRIEISSDVFNSSVVYPDSRGALVYEPYTNSYGDHFVIDFSQCGYGGGGARLPEPETIPAQAVLEPASGDDGARIQDAIDQVSGLPLDTRGFRGAVLLKAGRYEVSGVLEIAASGVVLRGEGDGENETVLVAAGTGQRTFLEVGGSGSWSKVSGTEQDIIDRYIPVGSRHFHVADPSPYQVGDQVVVERHSTQAWIDENEMNLLDNPWRPGSKDLLFDRLITHIEGNRITVDAPICDALDTSLGSGTVWRYTYTGRIGQVGVEFIRAESEFTSPTDEDHAWNFIRFDDLENAWARNVTSKYFGYACVYVERGAKWVTVVDSSCLDAISQITGSRRYSFPLKGQMVLVNRCYAREGRHDFVMHSQVPGPNAFVDCAATIAHSDSGPHHRWSAGVVYDNVRVYGNAINLRNRFNSGTGHGWAGANQVVWNSRADSMNIQRPITAQNWSIGNEVPGTSQGNGFWELEEESVFPTSLYQAQVSDRLALESPGRVLDLNEEGNLFEPIQPLPDTVVTLTARIQVDDAGAGSERGFSVRLADSDGSDWLGVRLDSALGGPVFRAESGVGGVTETLETPLGIEDFGGAIPYTIQSVFELRESQAHVSYRIFREDVGSLVWRGDSVLDTVPGSLLTRLVSDVEAGAVGEIEEVEIGLASIERYYPFADSTVAEASPAENFGESPELALRGEGTNQEVSGYLKFVVDNLTAPVIRARLKLHSETLAGGLKVYRVLDSSWTETGITWASRPTMGVTLDREVAIAGGEWVELDLSALVDYVGVFTLGLRGDTDLPGLSLSSREDPAFRPVLEILTEAAVGPTSVASWRLY